METLKLPIGLGLMLGLSFSSCPWHRGGSQSPGAPHGEAPECRADIPLERYAKCTCAEVPADPGPGDVCDPPWDIYKRACLIDSSCNAYLESQEEDWLAPDATRDDVAVRWEFVDALPADVDLRLNLPPADDASRTQTPLALYGKKDPTEDDIALSPGPDTWIDAEVLLGEDRKSITIVPRGRCLAGAWFLRAELMLDLLLARESVCGEPDFIGLGYATGFALE